LINGAQHAYGPRDEILMKMVVPQPQPAAATAPNLKVVRDVPAGSDR
jgi:hypothetical protein